MKAAWIALMVLPLLAVTASAKVLPAQSAQKDAQENNQVANLRSQFLDAPGFMQRWRTMLTLERQHLYGLDKPEAEDLRLKVFPADLLANESEMARAQRVGDLIGSDGHERVVSETLRLIGASGDGSRETPYAALSETEAMRYMALTGHIPVATALVVTRLEDPLLAVWFKDDASGQPWYFSLKSVFRRLRRDFAFTDPMVDVTGYQFLVHMAERGSPAALVGRAATILAANEPKRTAEIVEWLHTAERAHNALALLLLGDIDRKRAGDADPSHQREQLAKALAHYAQASDLGFVPAAKRIQEVKSELAGLAPTFDVADGTQPTISLAD